MNLLLVDDEKLALQALEKAVSKAVPNGTVSAFGQSRKAIEYAKANKIDIAFLDVDMPVMNGLKMAEELQKTNPKMNIIFVTGFAEYAIDAFNLYASAYLTKPVKVDAIISAINNLRYPVGERRVRFHCFGNFEVYCDNRPVIFSFRKTKELLAYLVDRAGAECRKNEIIAVLFEDVFKDEYYKRLRRDLIKTFSDLGIEDTINVSHGGLAINKDKVYCDYYDYLEEGRNEPPLEYMTQYSFAETTLAYLLRTI